MPPPRKKNTAILLRLRGFCVPSSGGSQDDSFQFLSSVKKSSKREAELYNCGAEVLDPRGAGTKSTNPDQKKKRVVRVRRAPTWASKFYVGVISFEAGTEHFRIFLRRPAKPNFTQLGFGALETRVRSSRFSLRPFRAFLRSPAEVWLGFAG